MTTTAPTTTTPVPGPLGSPDPLATGVSRERLYSMMRAYKQTALLRTAVELGIFDAIAAGAREADTIAIRIGADPRGTRILLDALAALSLVGSERGHYSLDEGARELLVSSSPRYYGAMTAVVASDDEWEAMRRLGEAVRTGGAVVETHAETPGYSYWEVFAASVSPVMNPAACVLSDLVAGWGAQRPMLDVLDIACGHGLHGFAVADRLPQARVWGLDWDNVLPHRRRHAELRGLGERTAEISGDMFETDLGGPYDLVLITNVLHHFSEQRSAQLLSRAAGVLRPGGRVGIVGFVIDDELEPAQDPEPHLFATLMLTWTHAGEVHTTAGYHRMLAAAGLRAERSASVTGLPFHVLLAERDDESGSER
jgi:SAM-dependent methyltransferase